ncbi:MAG: hypothetical protein HQK75_16025 [Candidatus Magnetomorum sp.]|nr:hypothetical protein [Candidatus Magnetomorum sp.]
MIQSISTSIFASFFLDAAKNIYKKFNPPLKRALEDTSVYFSTHRSIELNTKRLQSIIDGEFAQQLMERFQSDQDSIDEKAFALEFANFADLYFENEQQTIAVTTEILEFFSRQLERHILVEDNLIFLKDYIDQRFNQNTLQLNQLHELLSSGMNHINDIKKRSIPLRNNMSVNISISSDIPIKLSIHQDVKDSMNQIHVTIERGDTGMMSRGIEYTCPALMTIHGYREANDIILLDKCGHDDISAIIESIENEYLCFYQVLCQDASTKWVENIQPQEIDDIKIPIKLPNNDQSLFILMLDEDENQLKISTTHLLDRLNHQEDKEIMDSTIILMVYIQKA